MVDEIGGFSDAVPHDYTDVEYSYYAESTGWELDEVPELLALFNKSRPSLGQRIHAGIKCAHPVLPEVRDQLAKIALGQVDHCNLCGFSVERFSNYGVCDECSSSPQDRSLFRWLSEGIYMHRRLPAIAVDLDDVMRDVWKSQFQGPILNAEEMVSRMDKNGRLPNRADSLDIGIFRLSGPLDGRSEAIFRDIYRMLKSNSPIVIQLGSDSYEMADHIDTILSSLRDIGFESPKFVRYSGIRRFMDWAPILTMVKTKST